MIGWNNPRVEFQGAQNDRREIAWVDVLGANWQGWNVKRWGETTQGEIVLRRIDGGKMTDAKPP